MEASSGPSVGMASQEAESSFDDIELGPLVPKQDQLSCGISGPRNARRVPTQRPAAAGAAGAASGGGGRSSGGRGSTHSINIAPGFIDFDFASSHQEAIMVEGGKPSSSKPGSRAPSFSLLAIATSRAGASAGDRLGGGKPGSRPASFSLLGPAVSQPNSPTALLLPPRQDVPPVSTAAGGVDGTSSWPDAAEAEAQPRRSALALMSAPVRVPICSVLFCLVAGILAVVFFALFLAHHDGWEETGCMLLLTASSATAGPASLVLQAVRDPATLVCLGKEEHGPMVREDSLAALLAAHSQAFSDAHAQLSFTSAGGTARWAVSLEVEGVALNATVGSATIQVDDWEEAEAADPGTIYPGTEAFAAQFGLALGQPLLVFRLDDTRLAKELAS